MAERTPRPVNLAGAKFEVKSTQKPEKAQPLTLTLSPHAQRGVYSALLSTLGSDTANEVEQKISQSYIATNDSNRMVATQLARNLGEEMPPSVALYLGLTDFIPPEQLELWANQQDKSNEGRTHYARYFLEKQRQREQHIESHTS